MHPPLDRPHPDCQQEIFLLKQCHLHEPWYKQYTGICNEYKTALDQCFKQEKLVRLAEMNQNLLQQRQNQENMVQIAFNKNMTFSEYLQRDHDYQQAIQQKQQQQNQSSQS